MNGIIKRKRLLKEDLPLKIKRNRQDTIAKDIANKIQHKIYAPNSFLPSEHQLSNLYGTSRETIRKALDQLTELGLIQK